MSNHVSKETAVRIRSLLKAGFTQAEIAVECGVSLTTVARQAKLLEVLTKWRRSGAREANYGLTNCIDAQSKGASRMQAQRGHEFSEFNLDLCDIFETPRSPRQIARALRGQE